MHATQPADAPHVPHGPTESASCTGRELFALQLLARGYSLRQVAALLAPLGGPTFSADSIMRALGARSVAGATARPRPRAHR